jgi:SAM-dependent methyltransferase
MVRQAVERNRRAIELGKARILHADLLDLDADSGVYDKIFAMNVNAFWMRADREFETLRRLLGPDGTLYLAWVPPSAGKIPHIVEQAKANLDAFGFQAVQVVYSDFRLKT